MPGPIENSPHITQSCWSNNAPIGYKPVRTRNTEAQLQPPSLRALLEKPVQPVAVFSTPLSDLARQYPQGRLPKGEGGHPIGHGNRLQAPMTDAQWQELVRITNSNRA